MEISLENLYADNGAKLPILPKLPISPNYPALTLYSKSVFK